MQSPTFSPFTCKHTCSKFSCIACNLKLVQRLQRSVHSLATLLGKMLRYLQHESANHVAGTLFKLPDVQTFTASSAKNDFQRGCWRPVGMYRQLTIFWGLQAQESLTDQNHNSRPPSPLNPTPSDLVSGV